MNACIYSSGKAPVWGGSTGLSREAVGDMRWVAECFHAWNREGSPIWVQSTIMPVQFSIIGDAGPAAKVDC